MKLKHFSLLLIAPFLGSSLAANCPQQLNYAHADWASTAPGQLAAGTCVSGWEGNPTRSCDQNGQWASLVQGHCTRKTCPESDAGNAHFPKTNALSTATGECDSSYKGIPPPTRPCLADGTWGAVSNPCHFLGDFCPQEHYAHATWFNTEIDIVAIGNCDPGWDGQPERYCKTDTTWDPNVHKHCTRLVCKNDGAGNAVWPDTYALNTGKGTCNAGWVGNPSRPCEADGTWGDIANPCIPNDTQCGLENYARATWQPTVAGNQAIGSCDQGWEGSPTRLCQVDGTWASLVQNHCTRKICSGGEVNGISFPSVQSGVNAPGTCPAGQTGNPYRYCDPDGVWQAVTGSCTGPTNAPTDAPTDAPTEFPPNA